MRNDFESNYLAHHGILGMKWGKRNGPPYPLETSQKTASEKNAEKAANASNTSEERKGLTDKQKRYIRNGAIAAGVALAAIGGLYLYKKGALNPVHIQNVRYGTIVDLSKLSSKPTIISKNTKLQRISSTSSDDYVKTGKSFYASYSKKDNSIYKEVMPKYIKRWYSNGIVDNKQAYVNKIKLKRDISIASERDVADAYMKVNKVDKVDEGHLTMFMKNLVSRDTEINKSFVNELKIKGFDGIIDTNDAGIIAKSPLLIFNSSEIVDSVATRKLGNVERFINVLLS